jgi:hypothetical protein
LQYSSVNAATLQINSNSSTLSPGEKAILSIVLNSESIAINNAEAVIKFPAELLDVVSVSKNGSIFSLWVEEPSFSNSTGIVTFNGGVPTPGFNGTRGSVVSFVVRAKKAGQADFTFSSAAVRANDGLGTNVLTSQLPATVSIIVPVAQEPEKPRIVSPSLLAAPIIYSSVFTDQNSWYSAKAGIITWVLPTNATAVQFHFNNNPNSVPSINYAPPILQKEVKNLADGVWYFHLRYSVGDNWSGITHYKIQIDTQQPYDLATGSVKNNDGTTSLNLSAKDALSGIDYYNMAIDGQPVIKVSATDAKNPVSLPKLSIGSHQVVVSAYDKAGNKNDLTTQVVIESGIAPVIDKYTKEIKAGEKITISGTSIYPQTSMKVVINPESGDKVEYNSITDENGNFSFVSEPVNLSGNYQIWVYISGQDGSISAISVKQNLLVKQSIWAGIINKLTGIKIPSFHDTFVLVVAGLVIILVALFGWYKYFILRRRFKLIEQKANHAFKFLLKRARKNISTLDKLQKAKGSSPEEKKTIDDLKEITDEIENLKKDK